MKSPTDSICTEAGSLIVEAMIAISVLSVFLVFALSLVWTVRAMSPVLESRRAEIASANVVAIASSTPSLFSPTKAVVSWFDNWSTQIYPLGTTSPVYVTVHDSVGSFGASTCNARFDGSSVANPIVQRSSLVLGSDVVATDIVAKNDTVYMTADSGVQARHDFYIYDNHDHTSPQYLSSIHTGPGLNALVVAGHYVYVANAGSTNQLQVIDIIDRKNPVVVARLKLPLPNASTTAPNATSIAYAHGWIYLGTEKWNGPEFSIIDVSSPVNPIFVAGLEIGSVVKNILVRGDFAYIATAGDHELTVIDIRFDTSPVVAGSAAAKGSGLEVGSRLLFHHDALWFTRNGGGFNTSGYQEIFSFDRGGSLATSSNVGSPLFATHVSGGVYGVAISEPYVFVATGDSLLEIWDMKLANRLASLPIGSRPVAMSCDRDALYIAPNDGGTFIRISF